MSENEQPQVVTEEVASTQEAAPVENPKEKKTVGLLGQTEPIEEKSKKKFPWLILIVILVILAAGLGFFTWYSSRQMAPKAVVTPIPETIQPTAQPTSAIDQKTAELEEVGESDELDEIEADLNKTDLDELDQEFETIEKELE